jgi:hypothetical protein
MKDTLTNKPLTDYPSNTTHSANSSRTAFKSDVFILNTYSADEALAVGSTYSVAPVEVKNLNTPITFEVSVSNLETATSNMTEIRTECVFMNETSMKWEKLTCSNAAYNGVLNGNKVKCCSPHMT